MNWLIPFAVMYGPALVLGLILLAASLLGRKTHKPCVYVHDAATHSVKRARC